VRLAALCLALAACVPPAPTTPRLDACVAACSHRAELGCLEPALATQCVSACERATALGWYRPELVARASREELRALGVRCSGAP